MADIGASNWSETDNNNTSASPDGLPEGCAPSGVNNWARADMGATKRFWNKINAVKTTAGTTSAYTLSYDVAPGAYYGGEIISFVVNATNAAAATLNVNALGAKPLRLFGGNLLAGALVTDQIVQARYNSSAGAFDILGPQGFVVLSTQVVSGVAAIDFTSIPAAVNHIHIIGNVTPATDGANIIMRTYGADGVLDTGASDYSYTGVRIPNSGVLAGVTATAASILMLDGIDNSDYGMTFDYAAGGIQRATRTQLGGWARGLGSDGSTTSTLFNAGVRNEADRISGVRIVPSTGNISGTVTLLASA